jgi:hypothetical protein
MTAPQTVKIDDAEYVRKDAAQPVRDIGNVRIIVADRGWVFVGNCTDQADGSVVIRNTRNIRRWGTTKGLGELITGPTKNTVVDAYGEVQCTPIVQINVISGW